MQQLSRTAYAETGELIKKNNPERIIRSSFEYYKRQRYDESLALLESVRKSRDQYINWYYYYAINKMRLEKSAEALANLDIFIKKSNQVYNMAKAYYFMGLIQFNQEDYDRALNSLELALDVSNSPQLDKRIETLIDKTIRYQRYYENSKKTNISFILGYNFDTNVINLSPNSFADNLNGHIFGYGMAFSHKIIDKYTFVFEPSLAILDNYTFDSKFKSNSTLQSTDALQFLLSAPFRVYFDDIETFDKLEVSLNAYSVYLPVVSTTRELSVSSVFVKTQLQGPFKIDNKIKYNATFAVDKSYGYTSDDDDASGFRSDFLVTLVQYLSKKNITNIFYDLGIGYSGTKGVNTKYQKYSTAVGYIYPSFSDTYSSLRLGYNYLNYSEKPSPRTDNQVNFLYNITKDFSAGASAGISMGYVNNGSNVELNKYSDLTVGVQYIKSFGF